VPSKSNRKQSKLMLKKRGGRKKTVNVYCRNGHLLFKNYLKVGRGKLIKCYFDKIATDYTTSQRLPVGEDVPCADKTCGLRIGRVAMVRGRPAVKLNQGGIKQIRI